MYMHFGPEVTIQFSECFRGHLEDISDLCWSGDGKYMISASVDTSAILWDVKKGELLYSSLF